MDMTEGIMSLLRAVIFLLGLATSSTGEIRCYCNDASCVRTGYMCKSPMGRCFSQLSYERDSSRSVHGCVENLPLSSRDLCEGTGHITEAKTGDRVKWPMLLCCKEDMCNYMDNLDINIYVTKSNNTKDNTVWSGVAGHEDRQGFVVPGDPPYSVHTTHRDVWFKAAVIAVPIAGGFILVLLVLLAIRVLRNDNRRHRQLVQLRHHRSLTKAQLYVADHFYHNELLTEKCEKFPKCDTSFCPIHQVDRGSDRTKSSVSRSSIHSTCAVHSSAKSGTAYRDVHIKLDHSKNGYEKIRPISEGSTIEDTCDSVVLWGEPVKSASHV